MASTYGARPASLHDVQLYAGFWRRGAAMIIDTAILLAPDYYISRWAETTTAPWSYASTWVLWMVYLVAFHSSPWMATPGKRLFGIKVTTLGGERIGVVRAFVRYLGSFVSALLFGLGYLMAAWTDRKQGLHDKIAGTLVVRRSAGPEEILAGGGVMRISPALAGLFVLLVLSPLIAAGFMMYAIPAWHDHAGRAKVRDVMRSTEPLRAEVTKALAEGRDPVMSASLPSLESARSIVVNQQGEITIRLVDGARIQLRPAAGKWRCSVHGLKEDFLPQDCRLE